MVDIARLLLDFGMIILIWMVQLLIYPSFHFYEANNLFKWHKKYTSGLSKIVIPLMLGQLIIAVVQLFERLSIFSISYALLIGLLWGITFLWFVPIHKKIAEGVIKENLLQELVTKNWLRTVIWTFVFALSFYQYLSIA